MKRLSDVFDDEIDRLAEKFGDRETALELVEEDHSLVRFYLPPEASWSAEIRRLTTAVGQRLTEIIRAITKANPTLQGVIDIVDFNATVSGQRIIDNARLSTLIEILSQHRLGLKDVEPDLLGRAYEYLLRKFAEGQGQSAGEFFTPKEVGWLIARLLQPKPGMTIYDPACGSGGLLVKAQLVANESPYGSKQPLHLYGQELNHVTYAIAKMNMIIHDMEGEVAIGDTLRSPKFVSQTKVRTFDLVAANPMWNQTGYDDFFYEADSLSRFGFGYPTGSSADWGWIQLMYASLNEHGRAVIVLDSGAVSRGSGGQGGNRERDIRRQFVERDLIEAVVLLPPDLFYNTSSPGILLCLNRAKPEERRNNILVINASTQFEKGRPKNFIPDEKAELIVGAFQEGEPVEGLVKIITREEAAANDYNLSPSRYVAREDGPELMDVVAAFDLVQIADESMKVADAAFRAAMERLGLTKATK